MINLNLLPPTQKDYLRHEHIYLYLRSVIFLILTFSLVISAMLLGARLLLQDHFIALVTSSNEVNDHNGPIDHDIESLNQNLAKIKSIQTDFVKWSSILTTFARTIPPGVQITYLDLERSTLTFSLSGVAATRDSYLQLKDNLEALPYFEHPIEAPFSSILQRENVKFDFNGKLNAAALQTL